MLEWFLGVLVIVMVLSFASVELAAEPVATDIRIGSHSDKTRFVIDISENVKFKVFTLSEPYRVVVDLPEVGWRLKGRPQLLSSGVIEQYRYGLFRSGLSRVVLDLNAPVKIKSAFILPPAEGKQYRLVLDLATTSREQYIASLRPPTVTPSTLSVPDEPPTESTGILPPGRKPAAPGERTRFKKPVIVIDPGHGGIDPGSTSGHVFEKHITLAIAKVVKAHLERNGKYVVKLTRSKDIFIRLRKRIAIARAQNADMFISLHADAIKNKRVRGLSVYTLSERASDREAADLAEQENKSDLIAGMDLSTESKEVTNILIDLAQRETMNESSRFAGDLVKHIRKITKTLKNVHRFAGFAVLKAPDVPSILIEMGFLSNKTDEKALLNTRYRKRLASAIGNAVEDYFDRTRQAQR